jgi:site-specific DNA recombinase
MEEFRRGGSEVVFLNRAISSTAEDDLLLQMQGVIAEYERAKILERSRRGRRHAARSGLLMRSPRRRLGTIMCPRIRVAG